MPTFLSDPSPSLYLLLLAAVVATGAIAIRVAKRKAWIAFAIAGSLLLGLFLIDFLSESPREQAVRKVKAISEAINKKEWNQFDLMISDRFDYQGLNKPAVKELFRGLFTQYDAETTTWDFNRDRVEYINDNELRLFFDAKATNRSDGTPFLTHFRADFVREADGEWRLKSFARYDYAKKTNAPEEMMPGLR